MTDRFPDANVNVTLTGKEWTALLVRIDRPKELTLSPEGARIYKEAANKLGDQLLAAQKVINNGQCQVMLALAADEASFLKRRIQFLEFVAGTGDFDQTDAEGAALWRIIDKIKALPAKAE